MLSRKKTIKQKQKKINKRFYDGEKAYFRVIKKKIDEIDSLLIESISERARCAQHVAEVKEAQGDKAYYKPEREAQVLRRVMEMNQGPLGNEDMARLFRQIMSACLA